MYLRNMNIHILIKSSCVFMKHVFFLSNTFIYFIYLLSLKIY